MLRLCLCFVLAVLPCVGAADLSGHVQVVDADTWDIGSTRVRLHGIDAPERDQTCTRTSGEVWACGTWATHQAHQLYGGRAASCQAITQDRYGRTVARCTVRGQDVGDALVSRGIAVAFRKYSRDYIKSERQAKVAAVGIHAGGFTLPWDHRAAKRASEQPGNCLIKGNISAKGERIFHRPGQAHYARTRISIAKGERWFCTVAEARRAGWRAARN